MSLTMEGAVRTRWTELLELEEMIGELTMSALKLVPGRDRRDSLISNGSFRDRIAALKWASTE